MPTWTCEIIFSSSSPHQSDDVTAGLSAFIGIDDLGGRAEAQTVAGFQDMALPTFGQDQLALFHPHHMSEIHIGRSRKARLLARRHLDLHHLQRMTGIAEDLAPD